MPKKTEQAKHTHTARWSDKMLGRLDAKITAQQAEIDGLRDLVGETISHIDGWHDLTTPEKRRGVLDRGDDLLVRLRTALKSHTESEEAK